MDCSASLAMTAKTTTSDETKHTRENAIMIEFFFDCSSPWTYLAFHNIQPLAKEFGVEIVVAADPGRRHLQYRQSQRLCLARDAGAG